MELAANLALSFHPLRPMHDHAVARAAPVRGDLFRPLIGRAKRVRPADRIMVVGLGRAEILDLRQQEFGRLDPRHAVQCRHLIEAAVERPLGGGAVVPDDVIDQRVVEHAEVGERIHQAPDMVIDLLQEARIDLHLARQNGLQVRRHFVPRGNFLMPGGERGVVRNDAELLLPGERFLAQLVPAAVELAFVFVRPFLRDMMGRVRCARREIHHERLVRHQRLLLTHPGDGAIGQILGQRIALLGRLGRLNG